MVTLLRIVQLLTLLVLTLLCLSLNISWAAIGSVTEQKGTASITHNKQAMDAKPKSPIDSNDLVQTGSGVVGITFEDNTQVRVTENSKLVIDDFVYDPNKKGAGKLALKVAMGTVRYASGNIAHENNKNVAINTPTATVAVRGTAFTMTVDEVGKSLIILLPNKDGSVGMIDVITSTGTVTGGNLATAGTLSAGGNANVGNLGTGGLITATGNLNAGNIITAGIMSSTGNATHGNIITGGLITATGNKIGRAHV